jgi:hypothetical protein
MVATTYELPGDMDKDFKISGLKEGSIEILLKKEIVADIRNVHTFEVMEFYIQLHDIRKSLVHM